MGWEDRNGNAYYYRKCREGKRVVSEYIGGGLVGQIADALDREERSENGQERASWLQHRTDAHALDIQIANIERMTQAIMRAGLLLAGYHAPKRQWRKIKQ